MEDDDEFGDLYTDVLKPFAAAEPPSPAPPPPPLQQSIPTFSIDLNLKDQTLDSREIKLADFPKVSESKPLINDDRDFNFDIEADEPVTTMIPGLNNTEDSRKDDVGGGGGREDWDDDEDSDSEDDLQIVLNDNHHGPMSVMMERGGIEDDDDEEAPLVILGNEDASNQGIGMGMGEEQDWVDDAEAAAGKANAIDGGEATAGKANAIADGLVIAPKLTYSNHVYHHPFHSQFKYVRPGVPTMPGTPTVGPSAGPGQVRPPVNMGLMAGRGRGDWRPSGNKGFHPWGSGRGFGGGLDFTLPSHKTIFEVDIDSFEEKLWKYPGVDVTDFFNFGLNEESWKDYCKQLEQYRLETNMQSKIRVYESGRTEKDYDPDLPPELAAATGMHEISAENANIGKLDIGQTDVTNGSIRARPPLPTGRAIQVEGGSGERLPSIDTRPPRLRDSDAIIEIPLLGSIDDDDLTKNGVEEQVEPTEDLRGDNMTDDNVAEVETEYTDGFSEAYNGPRRELNRRPQFMGPVHDGMPERRRNLPYHPEAPFNYRPGSIVQAPVYYREDFSVPFDQRRMKEIARDRSPHIMEIARDRSPHIMEIARDRSPHIMEIARDRSPHIMEIACDRSPHIMEIARDRSPHMKEIAHDRSPHLPPNRSKRDKKLLDNQNEESVENKHSPESSSPAASKDARELSVEHEVTVIQESVLADGSPTMDKEEITTSDTPKDQNLHPCVKKQKTSSQLKQSKPQELDDGEDSKAARNSENGKARSGSSRDYQKLRDSGEEEVAKRPRSSRKHVDDEPNFRRKDRDERQVVERKDRDSYLYRDMDPSLSQHSHMKTESFDRRKERNSAESTIQCRDEDPYSRKGRTEDTRKRECVDEIGSRQKGKLRENERSDKDHNTYSIKQSDNGNFRAHYEEDVSLRHRERDDSSKSRFEIVDEYHSKRRKDPKYFRRDHTEKEEFLPSLRENAGRRKRERDGAFDSQKREDHLRVRENLDGHHSIRQKDETWLQRERVERAREREDWHRLKQPYADNLPKREKDEGRIAMRSGRSSEEKVWVGHSRAKDEYKGSDKDYQLKDMSRHGEQLKKRDRAEDGSSSYQKGREDVYAQDNQTNEERKSRQGRSSSRTVNTSENQRMHKKHKESSRKNKDSEGGDANGLTSSKKNQGDPSGQINEMGSRGASEHGNGANEILLPRNTSRKHKEEGSSDDEHPDSSKGRSKFERWTSHKERDFNNSINSKSSTSLKFKEIDKNKNGMTSETSKIVEEPAAKPNRKVVEVPMEGVDNSNVLEKEKNAMVPDCETKPVEDNKHSDTVEKLKKRSERFKLSIPGEKSASAIKVENEAMPPPVKSEAPANSEIKPERPARKRRWVGN